MLLMLAAPGLSQSEDEPYFSLSSMRTFGAGGKPSVSLNAWNVAALEFRVYRINDPVQFFQQLESAHEFGGRAPRPPHQRTLLERIHAWKHGLRTSIRRGLRNQFTESPSAHLENAFAGGSKPAAPAPATGGTQYAEAPVLNSQQLVLTFHHAPKSHNRWESQNVDVAVKDRGVYLVEAVRGELRAYTILMVSDLVMVTKTGNGRIVNFLADRNTGEPVRGAQLFLLTRDARKDTAESDANGLAELKIMPKTPNRTTCAWWRAAAPTSPSTRWPATPSRPAANTGWATSTRIARSTAPATPCTSRASCASAAPPDTSCPRASPSRWKSRTPSRSPSIGRRSPRPPPAPFATISNCPPAPRSAATRSRFKPAGKTS